MLAAATQRTSRIELGTAVTPLGWENPLRLAEDLATVDVLSGGRLNPGVSVGPPMHYDEVKEALYPDTADVEDFSYDRVRAAAAARPRRAGDRLQRDEGIEAFSDRVQPHSPGLGDRMWYGGASLRSAQWAGEHGMNLLTSSVVKAEESEDFAEIQLSHMRAFRAAPPRRRGARVSQGLVVIPTDTASAEQRAKYAAYAEARTPRTATPQGPARLMFAPDLVGTSDEIAERLYAHAAFREVDEVAFALPFTLRARRLRPDPHRHGDQARPGAGLATRGLTPFRSSSPGRGTILGCPCRTDRPGPRAWRWCSGSAGRRLLLVDVVDLVVIGVVVACTGCGGGPPGGAPRVRGQPREQGYADTFGADSKAPYLSKTLTSQGVLLKQFFGIAHHSLPNYLAQISGQAPNPDTQDDCTTFTEFEQTGVEAPQQAVGRGCVYPSSVTTIADQLETRGLSWRGYLEDMGTPCRHPDIGSHDATNKARDGDQYATKHNPFVYFHSIVDSPSCRRDVVDLSHLQDDLATKSTTGTSRTSPRTSATTVTTRPASTAGPAGSTSADAWLRTWVPRITASPAFRADGMLVVTFDEAENGNPGAADACCGQVSGPNTDQAGLDGPGGGRIGAVVLSPFVEPGSGSDRPTTSTPSSAPWRASSASRRRDRRGRPGRCWDRTLRRSRHGGAGIAVLRLVERHDEHAVLLYAGDAGSSAPRRCSHVFAVTSPPGRPSTQG